MAFEVDLEELQKEQVLDSNKILNEYFTKKNINLKTQIDAPAEFTTLDTLTSNFDDLINFNNDGNNKHTFTKTSKTLNHWLDKFKEYMVSNKRASRLEVADVLKAIKEQENNARSWTEKLTGMGKS